MTMIIFLNAKKSQLLYYGSHTNDIPCTPALSLHNGQKIQFVKSCTHLGNKLCPSLYIILVDNAVNDLNCKLNNPLADFSHCNSSTLSILFQSYCMNVYGCQIWSYNIKYVNKLYTAWRKAIRRIWEIDYRTHNKLLHGINDCIPIDITLEKRCIKFTWSLMNSKHTLYNSIVKYSLYNASTVTGENICYLMSKCGIYEHEWYKLIYTIYNQINNFVEEDFNVDNQSDAVAIRELCESRDSCDDRIFDRAELNNVP